MRNLKGPSHTKDLLSHLEDTSSRSQLALVETSQCHDEVTHILFGNAQCEILRHWEWKRAGWPGQGDHKGAPLLCLRSGLPGPSIVGAMACPRPGVGWSPCCGAGRCDKRVNITFTSGIIFDGIFCICLPSQVPILSIKPP